MRRREQEFPAGILKIFCPTMIKFWRKGTFDDYAEEHFLKVVYGYKRKS